MDKGEGGNFDASGSMKKARSMGRKTLFGCFLMLAACSGDPDQKAGSDKGAEKDSLKPRQEKAKMLSIDEIEDTLAAEEQRFEFDPSEDTLLECQKGSKLYFPAHAFRLKDGSRPEGKVELRVKECYSMACRIGDKLPTRSGERLLETGGMLRVSAEKAGKPLRIAPDAQYAVYFPKKGEQKEGMKLFTGERDPSGRMNWKCTPSRSGKRKEKEAQQSQREEGLMKGNRLDISWTYTSEGRKDRALKWLYHRKKGGVPFYSFLSDTLMTVLADSAIADFCDTARSGFLNIRVEHRKDGQVKTLELGLKDDHFAGFDEKKLKRFLVEILSRATPSAQGKKEPVLKYRLVLAGEKEPVDNFQEKFEEKYASFRDRAVQKVNKAEMNYYVKSASEMGWINCDRFQNVEGERKDLYVKLDPSKDHRVVMSFRGIRSMMSAKVEEKRAVFSNVPEGRAVKVIGIHYRGGKPELSVKRTETGKKEIELGASRSFSLSELKEALNGLAS
ncbi:MAG: hypothetical protein ABEH38_09090 [Flavobacteriales bacterium]